MMTKKNENSKSKNNNGNRKKKSKAAERSNIVELIPGINDWLICSAYPVMEKKLQQPKRKPL